MARGRRSKLINFRPVSSTILLKVEFESPFPSQLKSAGIRKLKMTRGGGKPICTSLGSLCEAKIR